MLDDNLFTPEDRGLAIDRYFSSMIISRRLSMGVRCRKRFRTGSISQAPKLKIGFLPDNLVHSRLKEPINAESTVFTLRTQRVLQIQAHWALRRRLHSEPETCVTPSKASRDGTHKS